MPKPIQSTPAAGRAPRVRGQLRVPRDPSTLLGLYIDAGRSAHQLAKALGVSPQTVYDALEAAGLAQLYEGRLQRPDQAVVRSPVHHFVSNNDLARLYVELGYNWHRVAGHVGHSYANIYLRINKALQGPLSDFLRCLVEVKRGVAMGAALTDHHLAAAVVAHDFNVDRAALFLGMVTRTLQERVRAAGPESPLQALTEHWQKSVVAAIDAKLPAIATTAGDLAARVFVEHGFNPEVIATQFGIAPEHAALFMARILHHGPPCTLKYFLEVHSRHGNAVALTDHHVLAAALAFGNYESALEFLGMSRESLRGRALAAEPGSMMSLYRFAP